MRIVWVCRLCMHCAVCTLLHTSHTSSQVCVCIISPAKCVVRRFFFLSTKMHQTWNEVSYFSSVRFSGCGRAYSNYTHTDRYLMHVKQHIVSWFCDLSEPATLYRHLRRRRCLAKQFWCIRQASEWWITSFGESNSPWNGSSTCHQLRIVVCVCVWVCNLRGNILFSHALSMCEHTFSIG